MKKYCLVLTVVGRDNRLSERGAKIESDKFRSTSKIVKQGDSMNGHERFHYKTMDDLLETIDRLGINLPVSDDFAVLSEDVQIGSRIAPNRFVTQPMEGCDCSHDGTPTDLTLRRYRRFGSGGVGLIWFEACAIVPEARANPRQMMLTDRNIDVFKRMLDDCRNAARESIGPDHNPICILQLAHSGRYSKPEGKPAPIIAQHSAVLDHLHNLPPDYPLITDDELNRLQDVYVHSARLAAEAGFDGVDIKSCHGYLLAELLASSTREKSRYGGPEFENRTRFLRDVHRRVTGEIPNLIVTSRFNVYDGIPYPYGWAVDKANADKPDLSEPILLAKALMEQGAACLNMTAGNPYVAPHVNRPHDLSVVGSKPADEHPLLGVYRLIEVARQLQVAHPKLVLIGSGYTYLREFLPWFAAGLVKQRWISMVGLGRLAFAYPDFAKDILTTGKLRSTKVCLTCSKCTQIMRDNGKTGCVLRDSKVYGQIYREGRKEAEMKA